MRIIAFCVTMTVMAGGALHAQAFHSSIAGDFTNDFLGWAVSGIDDLNQDGVGDVLIGVPGFDGPAVDSGLVLVVSGKDGSLLFYLQSTVYFGEFGSAVAAVPDTNGDGLEDIAVGAPGHGPGGTTGAVYLYSGAGGKLLGGTLGSKQGAFLGESLASGFDVNGDGKGDVLAGEPGYSEGTAVQCGAVRLFSGANMSQIFRTPGIASYDQLGRTVAMLGDIDGDLIPESAAGMPGYDPPGFPGAGGVLLLSGTSGSVLRLIEGIESFAGFGSALAAFPDLNGDDMPEIMTGGPTATVNNHSNAGMVVYYTGDNPTPVQAWCGVLSNQYFGRTLAPAGCFDPDKTPDIAIGMMRPFEASGYKGAVRIYSGIDGGFLTDLLPGPEGDLFGRSIAAIGDINGDGWGDMVVGDPYSDLKVLQGGEARFYLGSKPYLTLDSTGKLGDPLNLNLRSFPSDLGLIMLDFHPGPTITPFGIFDLGFTPYMRFFPILPIPASGLLKLNLNIPLEPSLVGKTLYFQALVYHEPEYLTSSPDNLLILQ